MLESGSYYKDNFVLQQNSHTSTAMTWKYKLDISLHFLKIIQHKKGDRNGLNYKAQITQKTTLYFDLKK